MPVILILGIGGGALLWSIFRPLDVVSTTTITPVTGGNPPYTNISVASYPSYVYFQNHGNANVTLRFTFDPALVEKRGPANYDGGWVRYTLASLDNNSHDVQIRSYNNATPLSRLSSIPPNSTDNTYIGMYTTDGAQPYATIIAGDIDFFNSSHLNFNKKKNHE